MKTRKVSTVVVLAALAGWLSGCPSDSCSLETPQVSNVPANGCTVVAGQPVTYQVRLCPACNQTSATCAVDMSQVGSGYIYVDPKMEACSGGNSCPPPTCNTNATDCTFTAPAAAAAPYNVVIPDGQGGTYTRTLQVVASGTPTSCPVASAAPTTY